MLQKTATVSDLFQSARNYQAQAQELVEQGQLRAAAAKGWAAALTASNALLLARHGREPETLRETDGLMERMALDEPSLRPLATRYGALQGFLLETCVYDCFCGMEDGLIAYVRKALDYIQTAEQLAGA